MIQSLPTRLAATPVRPSFLRELHEAMRQRASIRGVVGLMGLDKRRPLWVDQPTITGRTHPAPDPRSPLFACLCRSMHLTQTAGLSAFFLETESSSVGSLFSSSVSRPCHCRENAFCSARPVYMAGQSRFRTMSKTRVVAAGGDELRLGSGRSQGAWPAVCVGMRALARLARCGFVFGCTTQSFAQNAGSRRGAQEGAVEYRPL